MVSVHLVLLILKAAQSDTFWKYKYFHVRYQADQNGNYPFKIFAFSRTILGILNMMQEIIMHLKGAYRKRFSTYFSKFYGSQCISEKP